MGGNCKKNEVLYELECKECNDRYPGETSRNAHARSIEHVEDSESTNIDRRDKSVIARHCDEKHDGKMVGFKMTVIKAFQHDPLGRQCAECLRIKSIEPSKRINNRKEYHQPGDVEVRYEKNESEEMKKKRKLNKERKEKRVENIEIEAQPIEKAKENMMEKEKNTVNSTETVSRTTVADFINQMRRTTETKLDNAEDDDVCSTQNMIEDARERRRGETEQKCDMCTYTTASKAMLRVHRRTKHRESLKEKQHKEDSTGDKESMENSEEKRNCDDKSLKATKYTKKRIQCEKCDKKFNKESRFKSHMKTVHEGLASDVSTSKGNPHNSISNNSNELTLPYYLRRHRVQQKAESAVQSPSV